MCEELTKGDVDILNKEPFVEQKTPKTNYNKIFGEENGKPGKKSSAQQNQKGKKVTNANSAQQKKAKQSTPQRPIVHHRFRGNSDHKVGWYGSIIWQNIGKYSNNKIG